MMFISDNQHNPPFLLDTRRQPNELFMKVNIHYSTVIQAHYWQQRLSTDRCPVPSLRHVMRPMNLIGAAEIVLNGLEF